MSQIFPPGHTEASLRAGLAAMAKIVGDAHVFTQPEHLAGFRDPYSLDAEAFVPSAAVAPASVQEVQALVRPPTSTSCRCGWSPAAATTATAVPHPA